MVWGDKGGNGNYNWFQENSFYLLSTQITITVIYTYNVCLVLCMLFVKIWKITKKSNKIKKIIILSTLRDIISFDFNSKTNFNKSVQNMSFIAMLSISDVFRSQLQIKFWFNMWYRNFIISSQEILYNFYFKSKRVFFTLFDH